MLVTEMLSISGSIICPCDGQHEDSPQARDNKPCWRLWYVITPSFFPLFLTSFRQTTGVRIKYLPPYSPNLNPIKEAFSKIKHWLHRHQDYYGAAEGDAIYFDMWEVLEILSPSDAEGYFFHAGYF
jgi:hypothetical protein